MPILSWYGWSIFWLRRSLPKVKTEPIITIPMRTLFLTVSLIPSVIILKYLDKEGVFFVNSHFTKNIITAAAAKNKKETKDGKNITGFIYSELVKNLQSSIDKLNAINN